MSAHRDFCRPPTRIDLSACLEFLVSAITPNFRQDLFHPPPVAEQLECSRSQGNPVHRAEDGQ